MRRLMLFTIAFTAAVAAYLWLLPTQAALYAAFGCAVVLLLLLPIRTDAAKRVRILAFGAAFGLLWSWGCEQRKLVPLRALCGENRTVTGEVCLQPERTDYGCRVEVRIDGGRAYFYLDADAMNLSLGDRVTVSGEVTDVSGQDDNLYFQSRDISLLVFQKGDYVVEKVSSLPVSLYPAAAGAYLRSTVTRVFPPESEGFVRALLTGDRSGLSYTLSNELSVAGVSHVIAVSGMHVSLLIGAIRLLLRRRRLSAFVSIGVMAFFAAMLGFSPSVTRAVLMNTILLLAPILQRENDAPTTLSFALLVLLLLNPWSLANASLQLSFLAMAGIFLITPSLYKRMTALTGADNEHAPQLYRRVMRTLSVSVSTSLGASLLTTPLVAYYFGTISLISIVTNALLLPLISLIFTTSAATALLGMLWTPLGALPAIGISAAVRFVCFAVRVLASLPFAALYTDNLYACLWLGTTYLMLAAAIVFRKRLRLRILVAAVLATLSATFFFSRLDGSTTRFTMLDVGQGQCLYFQDGGYRVVIDCGGSDGDRAGEKLARRLLSSGDSTVDALILTHYDTDHTGGIEQLLNRVTVKRLFLPEIEAENETRDSIAAAALREGTETVCVDTELLLELGEARVRLYPPTESFDANCGLAALMSFDECDILITGDMDIEAEGRLLRDYALPCAEVLIAGHHGSKYSTGMPLLEHTAPQLVLISVGENSYGHPTRQVLERIAAVGADVLRTDQNGDITITR